MRIFGVILAGGGGKRMAGADKTGADKALLDLGGHSLIWRAVARFQPQVEQLAISANGDAARFGQFNLPVLPDAIPQGPLSGILAALQWAGPLGATAVVSVAVDTPFFPGDLVPQLCLAAESSQSGLALAASGGQTHPTFGLWPTSLAPQLVAFLASGQKPRVLGFADAHHAARARFADPEAFMNLNTPQDFAAALCLIGGAR